MRLKMLTWNVHKGQGVIGSRPEFRQLAAALAKSDSDLVCCQEVLQPVGRTAQDRIIAGALSHHSRFTGHASNRRGVHGIATFCEWPISRHRHEDVSTNSFERRAVLHVRVHPREGETLHVFNVHFGLTSRQRRTQAERLAVLIGHCVGPDEPLIVAGDFNDWDRRIERHLTDAALVHNALAQLQQKERRTYPVRRPLFALDRIYYRGLELVGAKVLRGKPWTGLSDHLPLRAEFILPG